MNTSGSEKIYKNFEMDEPFDSSMDRFIRPEHRVESCCVGSIGFLFIGIFMIYFTNTEKYPVEFGAGIVMCVIGVGIFICTVLMLWMLSKENLARQLFRDCLSNRGWTRNLPFCNSCIFVLYFKTLVLAQRHDF